MRISITVFVLVVVCCGSEHGKPAAPADNLEELAAKTIEVMETYLGVLEKVTDVATAKVNLARIEELQATLQDLKQREEALGAMRPEQKEAMSTKYTDCFCVLTQRQGQIGMRLGKLPEVQEILRRPTGGANHDAPDWRVAGAGRIRGFRDVVG